ncbi:MAG: hypothetical protein KJ065_06715 [Anaerolineae bacterium]|nr:hypothetical protein [Anaerolineae bacterium]
MQPYARTQISLIVAVIAILLLATSGCSESDKAESAWEIMTIAQAEQSEPPALALVDDYIVTAWIGADTRGVHHDARIISENGLADPVTLPLPPRQPHAQQLIPGSNGTAHLLWLDADENGVIQLYSALIAVHSLMVIRGSTPVSQQTVLRFTALAEPGGSVLIAWAGGNPAEPGISLQRIDNEGRPTEQLGYLQAANYPTLLRANGEVYVYWLGEQDDGIYRTRIAADTLRDTERLTSSPGRAAGDRLIDMRAGTDRSYVYLFWNLARASGACETWFTTAAATAPFLLQPAPLKLSIDNARTVETGFNSGTVYGTQIGEMPICMAAPLSETGDTLAVGVQNGPDTVMVYFRDGQSVGQQVLATDTGVLLRPPVLLSDQDRNLYLAWSEPTASGVADLKLARSGAR